MIRVFGSIADHEPAETHAHGRIRIHDWMTENVHGYKKGDRQPVSIAVNGRIVVPARWTDTLLSATDDVVVTVQPAGGLDAIILSTLAIRETFRPILNALTPDIPKAIQAADAIDVANLRANTPRMGGTVPEILGSYRRYPDYLLPPRRFFHSERVQRLHAFLCIGAGEYDIPLSAVRIGDTPIAALGGAAEYDIYPPGADLSGEPAAVWWHTVSEVGGTATGNSGIELGTLSDVQQFPDASAYQFSGDDIIIPAGAGSFPAGWDNTLILRVENYRDYTITGGTTISGVAGIMDELGFSVGDRIEIDGTVAGVFLVASITSDEMTLETTTGTPVTILPNGAARLAFGFERMQWRITGVTSSQVQVERLDDTGAVDAGWPGWDDNTSTDAVVYVDGSTQVGWTGPFPVCPVGETVTEVEVDLFFPGGLARIRSDGDIRTTDQSVQLEWRDIATGGAWTTVNYTFSERTVDQIGFTRIVTLPSAIRPEVRMRRTGPASTEKLRADVQWYGLRGKVVGAPTSYPWTTLAIRINNSSSVSAQSENQINVVGTRILPELVAGEWTAPTATRDIAAGFGHVLRSIGYSDSQIDLEALDALNDIWRSRGEYFDYVFTETTVREAIRTILRTGMAEPTMQDGVLTPVRDGPRTSFETGQGFSPQNMTGVLNRSFSAPRYDDPDGVDVTYTDRSTWSETTVQCRLPGDAGERAEQITLDGVTDRTQAWRIGMRRRMEIKYRRWAYEFQTELEGLNASYLSYVPILDDLPEYGQSARMRAVEPEGFDYRVTVTEPLDWSLAGDFVWAFRRPDGTVAGPFPATQGGEYQIITGDIGEPWPDLSARQEPPHIYFGTSEQWCFPALIKRVQPTGGVLVNVEAVNYDDRVYQFDDQSPNEPANKAALDSALTEHCTACTTPGACSPELTSACEAGQQVYDDAGATQQEVDDAVQSILDNAPADATFVFNAAYSELFDGSVYDNPGTTGASNYTVNWRGQKPLPGLDGIVWTGPTTAMSAAEVLDEINAMRPAILTASGYEHGDVVGFEHYSDFSPLQYADYAVNSGGFIGGASVYYDTLQDAIAAQEPVIFIAPVGLVMSGTNDPGLEEMIGLPTPGGCTLVPFGESSVGVRCRFPSIVFDVTYDT